MLESDDEERQARFASDLAVGSEAAEIVADLLKASGYEVWPFGFENVLAPLGPKLRTEGFRNSALGHRIRSMPDLIVANDHELVLAEVKYRKGIMKSYKVFVRFNNWEIQRYARYWPETTLVLVTPHGWRFYASPIDTLVKHLDSGSGTDFELPVFSPLHEAYKRVSKELMRQYFGSINELRGTGIRRRRRR